MTSAQLESRAIEQVAAEYTGRGYSVEIQPEPATLPDFLEGYQPDLIARGPNESVLVEIKVGTETSAADRLRSIAERISRQPGWRFSLVFVDPLTSEIVTSATPPLSVVVERLAKAKKLRTEGNTEAAFLLLWSALEGVLRKLGEAANLPLGRLPPSALIRELYSAGELGRDQFELLIRLLPTRNELVHGFSSTNGLDIEALETLTESLLTQVSETPTT